MMGISKEMSNQENCSEYFLLEKGSCLGHPREEDMQDEREEKHY